MVNTHRKHVQCFIYKNTLCNENWLEAHYQQYHPISMNQGLLPNSIPPAAGFPHPKPSWLDYIRCTWMDIDKLSNDDLLIPKAPSAPPPEDSPNEDPIGPHQPDLTCTTDPTKTKAHRQVVGVENSAGKAYGNRTGLYNKHRKRSEHWNAWCPYRF